MSSKTMFTPEIASQFITKSIDSGGSQNLQLALRDVVRAHGIENISRKTGLGRPTIHKMLSEAGNPTYKNLMAVLAPLGLELTVRPIQSTSTT